MLNKHLLTKPLPLKHRLQPPKMELQPHNILSLLLSKILLSSLPSDTPCPQPSCLLMSFLCGECMVSLSTCSLSSLLGKILTLPASHLSEPQARAHAGLQPLWPPSSARSHSQVYPFTPLQSALPMPGPPRGKKVSPVSHPEKTKIVVRGEKSDGK